MSRRKAKAATKAVPTRKRRSQSALVDRCRCELVHAQAAVMTAVLALQGKGVMDHISISLRGVNNRIEASMAILDGKMDGKTT